MLVGACNPMSYPSSSRTVTHLHHCHSLASHQHAPSHCLCYALLGARAHRMLIGACDPMACPIPRLRLCSFTHLLTSHPRALTHPPAHSLRCPIHVFSSSYLQVLVLTVSPTRELAQQIEEEAKVLLKFFRGLTAASVVGGTKIQADHRMFANNPPAILVATPGIPPPPSRVPDLPLDVALRPVPRVTLPVLPVCAIRCDHPCAKSPAFFLGARLPVSPHSRIPASPHPRRRQRAHQLGIHMWSGLQAGSMTTSRTAHSGA